jgi:hypothetical protein
VVVVVVLLVFEKQLKKTDILVLFEQRLQWQLLSDHLPEDLSLLMESSVCRLAAWPVECETVLAEQLTQRGFERVGHKDISELWVLQDAAAALPERDRAPPAGFRRYHLGAADAERVNECWEHGNEESLPTLRECIVQRPSVAVSTQEGELCGWVKRETSLFVLFFQTENKKRR